MIFIHDISPPPGGLTPRNKILLALPLVAALVVVLAYYQLFASPVVIGLIFVAYVAVSLWNRRKFRKQSKG